MFCVLATLCNQTDHFFNWFELYLLNLLLLHEFLSNGEKCVVGDGMQELAVFLLRAPAHLVFAVMALHLSEREGTWWRQTYCRRVWMCCCRSSRSCWPQRLRLIGWWKRLRLRLTGRWKRAPAPRRSGPRTHPFGRNWTRSRTLPPGGFSNGRSRTQRSRRGRENPRGRHMYCFKYLNRTIFWHLLQFVYSWGGPIGQLPWCWHDAILIPKVLTLRQ